MRAPKAVTQFFAVRSPETVGRTLAVSAAVGVLGAGLAAVVGSASPFLPAALTAAGLVVALPRFASAGRVALGLGFLVLALALGRELPSLLVLPALLGLALSLEGTPGWSRAARLLGGPVLGALWAAALVEVLQPWSPATRLLELALRGAVGLFLGVGLVAAQVEWVRDPFAERFTGRSAEVWQRLTRALARLPRGPARSRLKAQVQAVALRLLARLDEARDVTAALATANAPLLRAELEALSQQLESAVDSAARAHLLDALRAHKDTLEQVDGLERQRERLAARAAAEVARLERAALCLEVAPPTGSLATLAERLAHLTAETA
ncbi:MAG: hypothetical protein IT380_19725 [Myxococcales bacterium]|nr:hypothetical protein [Myxococcales bacterium]